MVQILGKEVGTTGFGLMSFTWRTPPPPLEQSIKAMKTALDNGCVFWNAGDFYGTPEYNSLHLLKEYFTRYPEDAAKVVLSIKSGINLEKHFMPDGTPEFLERCVENCLKVLDGKKFVDIFEMARVPKNVDLEVPMKFLEGCVKEGKIGGIGLSECSAATIRKAAAVTKIAAVEVEMSLFSTDILSNGVLDTCGELDIPIVAYSPLGRGMLTGQITSPEDLPDDFRRHTPRFSKEAFPLNLQLVDEVKKVATEKGCSPGQIAMAWVRQKGNAKATVIPIPGASTSKQVVENAEDVTLNQNDMDDIDAILGKFPVVGDRYGGPAAAHMWG